MRSLKMSKWLMIITALTETTMLKERIPSKPAAEVCNKDKILLYQNVKNKHTCPKGAKPSKPFKLLKRPREGSHKTETKPLDLLVPNS